MITRTYPQGMPRTDPLVEIAGPGKNRTKQKTGTVQKKVYHPYRKNMTSESLEVFNALRSADAARFYGTIVPQSRAATAVAKVLNDCQFSVACSGSELAPKSTLGQPVLELETSGTPAQTHKPPEQHDPKVSTDIV